MPCQKQTRSNEARREQNRHGKNIIAEKQQKVINQKEFKVIKLRLLDRNLNAYIKRPCGVVTEWV